MAAGKPLLLHPDIHDVGRILMIVISGPHAGTQGWPTTGPEKTTLSQAPPLPTVWDEGVKGSMCIPTGHFCSCDVVAKKCKNQLQRVNS